MRLGQKHVDSSGQKDLVGLPLYQEKETGIPQFGPQVAPSPSGVLEPVKEGTLKAGSPAESGPLGNSINVHLGCLSKALVTNPRENAVQPRVDSRSVRTIKKKSLKEISRSKEFLHCSGRRSKRRSIASVTSAIVASCSGTEIHDSQIANMNRILCNQDFNHPDMEISPAPG
ncbi:hypothetical protein Ancab_007272 [Ancistrocladus abbreviatus]